MWYVVTPEETEKQNRYASEQFKRAVEEAERKRKARESHDACKCPHCGRNDPLPPWLY